MPLALATASAIKRNWTLAAPLAALAAFMLLMGLAAALQPEESPSEAHSKSPCCFQSQGDPEMRGTCSSDIADHIIVCIDPGCLAHETIRVQHHETLGVQKLVSCAKAAKKA